MICRFCGWKNPDDAHTCSRCGILLKNEVAEQNNSYSEKNDSASKNESVNSSSPQLQQGYASGPNGCIIHSCGYPLLPGTQICPNCRKPVNGSTPPPSDESFVPKQTIAIDTPVQSEMKKTVMDASLTIDDSNNPKKTVFDISSDKETAIFSQTDDKKTEKDDTCSDNLVFQHEIHSEDTDCKATINPFMNIPHQENQTPFCTIKPILRNGERNTMLENQSFNTESVVLNRSNTEKCNNTITSKQQAILTFDDGKWYIEDTSFLRSTFIHVSGKMELHDKDIILMGDRKFEFSTEK